MNLLNLLEEVSVDKTENCFINVHPVFAEQLQEEAEEYIQSIFKKFKVQVELPVPLTYVADNGIEIVISDEQEGLDVTDEFYGLVMDEFVACE